MQGAEVQPEESLPGACCTVPPTASSGCAYFSSYEPSKKKKVPVLCQASKRMCMHSVFVCLVVQNFRSNKKLVKISRKSIIELSAIKQP